MRFACYDVIVSQTAGSPGWRERKREGEGSRIRQLSFTFSNFWIHNLITKNEVLAYLVFSPIMSGKIFCVTVYSLEIRKKRTVWMMLCRLLQYRN